MKKNTNNYSQIIDKIQYRNRFNLSKLKTNMEYIPIVYEDNHIIVVIKPGGLASQKDVKNKISLIEIIKDYLKIKYNKKGNVYLGLIHRLDIPTTGLMVFAKTSKAASRLSKNIRENEFSKHYLAYVKGDIYNLELESEKSKEKSNKSEEKYLEDYIYKNSKKNMSFVVEHIEDIERLKAKKAILKFSTIKYLEKRNLSQVDIKLITGRHHQIRVQFANIGYPVFHDSKYDKKYNDNFLRLFAYKVRFKHPTLKKDIIIDVGNMFKQIFP